MKTRFASLVIGALVALSFTPGNAWAQLDSLTIIVLRPDRFVRIALPELNRIQGRVGQRTATSLTLIGARDTSTVNLAVIDTVWVRGRRITTGAILGGIVGAGGGVFLGWLVAGLCEYDCPGIPSATVVGGLLGAGAGAIVGGAIGAAIPRWRRIYPR